MLLIAAPIAMPAVNPIRPGDGRVRAAVLLDDHRRRGGCDVDRLRVVLRDVDDLRVGRLDDDHLLAARRGLRLDFLLRRGLQGPGIARLRSQPLDAREHRRPVRGERLTEPGRPIQLARHLVHDLRKQGQRHEARLEVVLQGGVLQLGAFQRRVALQELVERRHAGRIRRAQQHLREELVRIEGDRSEQAIEVVRGQDLTGRGRALSVRGPACTIILVPGQPARSPPTPLSRRRRQGRASSYSKGSALYSSRSAYRAAWLVVPGEGVPIRMVSRVPASAPGARLHRPGGSLECRRRDAEAGCWVDPYSHRG